MRASSCLLLATLGLASAAQAQSPVGNPPTQFPINAGQQKPTEANGFPGLPPRNGPLPMPQPTSPEDRTLHILQAGQIERNGETVTLTGGAKVQYRGYDIIADKVVGDLTTEIFEASGHVQVQGLDAQIKGDRVRISYPDRTYTAWDSNAQLQPSVFQGGLLDPAYVKAKESFGSQREIFSFDTDATTCNYDFPHYFVAAKKAVVRPNTRAIFHDMDLYVLGHKILHLPYLSVPLNEPTYRYIPEFGRDPEDGYFVKTRYGIPLNDPSNNLDVREDYFQKHGNVLGGDYSYAGKALSGLLSVYGLASLTHTLDITSQHQQQFRWGSLNLNANYQKNDFQSAPGATLFNTRAQLTFPQGRSNTQLSFYDVDNSSSGFSSKSQTITLGDTRFYSPTLSSNLNVSTVSNSGGSVKNQQVNLDLTADDDLKKALAHFEYQRMIPVGTVQNFFNASDKTPVLTFSSDAQRILGPKAPANLPFQTDLSVGQFIDAATSDHITRSAFDFNFQRLDNSLKRSHLSMNGAFQQGIYSDNTAQYVLNFGTVASYSLGPDTGLNLRWNYNRPYGFSPLVMDQTGNTNLITGDMSFRLFRPFLVGVQSGYDLEALRTGFQTPYQFVGVRTEYTPANWLSLRTLSTYDPTQKIWNSTRVDFAYRPGATFVSIGAQYDGQRQVWGATNLFVDGFKWGRLSTSALLQYNGYTKRFETQQYSFTYDLHCAEAVLQVLDNETGFNTGRQVLFFLRIKALPFQSPFGTGSFGQALGTGGGIRF